MSMSTINHRHIPTYSRTSEKLCYDLIEIKLLSSWSLKLYVPIKNRFYLDPHPTQPWTKPPNFNSEGRTYHYLFLLTVIYHTLRTLKAVYLVKVISRRNTNGGFRNVKQIATVTILLEDIQSKIPMFINSVIVKVGFLYSWVSFSFFDGSKQGTFCKMEILCYIGCIIFAC